MLDWCSDHIVDTWTMQPPMNNPAHALRDKRQEDDDTKPGTCLHCAKKYQHQEYTLVTGFIATCYLVMLIVPIIVTVDNSAHFYGSE